MSQLTTITYSFGDIKARVSTAQNLSPDFVDTILNDLRKQVVAGARQVGLTYDSEVETVGEDEG